MPCAMYVQVPGLGSACAGYSCRSTASAPPPQVSPGQQLPREGVFQVLDEGADSPRDVAYQDLFAGKRVVLFGLPGGGGGTWVVLLGLLGQWKELGLANDCILGLYCRHAHSPVYHVCVGRLACVSGWCQTRFRQAGGRPELLGRA